MKRKPAALKKPLSIYVHFPYCDFKCPFCNLNAWEQKGFDEKTYIESLRREYENTVAGMPGLMSDYVIDTVFMGGGTPSLFTVQSVEKTLEFLSDKCAISEHAEISIETHPLSSETNRLKGYREAGVNRVSIGVQSFSSEKLKSLGRRYEAESCFEAVENAKESGVGNISLDIIAGAPGETPGTFGEDIQRAADTGVTHLSVYNLEVEKGTRFYALAKRGELPLPSTEQSTQMIERAVREMEARGMERYEISSFAEPGGRCRHNINYWRSGDYIGLGAGAHSHLTTEDAPFGLRWANPRSPGIYMGKAGRGIVSKRKKNDAETGFTDCLMMGLRLAEGIDMRLAEKKFSVSVDKNTIEKLENGGFLSVSNGTVKMTAKGFLVANSIFVEITGKVKIVS